MTSYRCQRSDCSLLIERADGDVGEGADGAAFGPEALAMIRRLLGDSRREQNASRAAVSDDLIELARREARVGRHRPGVELADASPLLYGIQAGHSVPCSLGFLAFRIN
jgi:hypothetical protein